MSNQTPALNIVFVDDAVEVLEHLRRTLARKAHSWDMRFLASGKEALQSLDARACDVVVSDLIMPEMDGVTFLSAVRARWPQTIRMVLSADTSPYNHARSSAVAHRFLSKPFSIEDFDTILTQMHSLQRLMQQETLITVVAGLQRLPSLPALYQELMRVMQSADASLKKAARVVSKDLAMASKILQLVNSAYFGLRARVSDPEQAVALLGLDTVKALVLSMQTFSQYDHTPLPCGSLDALWRHGLTVAAHARAIAKTEGAAQALMEEAFTSALLHDIGTLVLAANRSEEYAQVMAYAAARCLPRWQVERELFGASHAEVGAYLLGMWGLGEQIVEAVAFHHAPLAAATVPFSPLTAVHVANALSMGADDATATQMPDACIDQAYLLRGSWTDRLPHWQDLCRQP